MTVFDGVEDYHLYADKDRYEKWADEKLKELQGQKNPMVNVYPRYNFWGRGSLTLKLI